MGIVGMGMVVVGMVGMMIMAWCTHMVYMLLNVLSRVLDVVECVSSITIAVMVVIHS